MEYLGINDEELVARGAIHTAKEISDQPSVWLSTYRKLLNEKEIILEFWNKIIAKSDKIILTGAGTSAYIGYSLEGAFQRYTGITTVSVATTHLVTHPFDYLPENIPTLLISFARSGNSPESVAATELADSVCKNCCHLVITCDEEGRLAKYQSKNEKFNFILPPESDDKSLAMTSSYTSMLLAGLLFARIRDIGSVKDQIDYLVDFGNKIITDFCGKLKEIAVLDFERAVFLGSGPLYGTATESHLKLQELTDGQIICINDTFLGFRHGPKAVVDEKTIVLFIFSNHTYVQKYERDLVMSMQKGKKAMLLIGVSECSITDLNLGLEIYFSSDGHKIEEEFLAVCSILPAQILGFYKSLELGLKPDNPSISGAISRVVEGVVIYDDLIQKLKTLVR
jgi:tagatose-6-phosphate ketose/aldose isomerase